MNKCENCRFYQAGVCSLPMWVDGRHFAGTVTDPENRCDLYEQNETLVTVEVER